MKKYFSQGKYTRANAIRSRRANKAQSDKTFHRRLIFKRHPHWDVKKRSEDRVFAKYKKLVAPPNFTLVGNPHPEKVIAFINRLKETFEKRQKVFVDLSHITTIESDALVVLLSAMIRFKAMNIPFDGNYPESWHCKRILNDSGFFQALYKGEFADNTSYLHQSRSKNLMVHAAKEVESARTARIIEDAAATIWGERHRCQGVQTTFLELMQNTMNHASPIRQGEKHWWLAVKHQPEEKKVRFAFADYGVGIFNSLANKPSDNKFFGALNKLQRWKKYGNNAELLRLIMHRKLHMTITEQYFRGQGLPGMVDSLEDNWFSNLHIITNNVYANIGRNDYRIMDVDFGGTFIYWEVSAQNRRFPIQHES